MPCTPAPGLCQGLCKACGDIFTRAFTCALRLRAASASGSVQVCRAHIPSCQLHLHLHNS